MNLSLSPCVLSQPFYLFSVHRKQIRDDAHGPFNALEQIGFLIRKKKLRRAIIVIIENCNLFSFSFGSFRFVAFNFVYQAAESMKANTHTLCLN